MRITLPNLILIPILSVIGMVIKLIFDTDYDWMDVLLINPLVIYWLYSIGYVILAYISIKIKDKNK